MGILNAVTHAEDVFFEEPNMIYVWLLSQVSNFGVGKISK